MTPIIFLAAAAGPPGGWEFRDEADLAGRPALTFRTVELTARPARPPHPGEAPPAGARFGVIPLGTGGRLRLAVVWHAGTGALWADADGDGRFAPGERHALAADPVAVRVAIPLGEEKRPRTVLVRRREDGLAHAVRGYVAGPLALGGETYRAAVTDGDADGAFDGAAADRLWIDRDRDGRFDPLTEQFPLGRPVAVGSAGYLVRPDPDGGRVEVTGRSKETGRLTGGIDRLPGVKVIGMTAQFVSEWGELVTLTAADEPAEVPVGRYRVESLILRLGDADGRVWEYHFVGDRRFVAEVAKGRGSEIDLTAGLRVNVAVGPGAGPGRAVEVAPEVATAAGLSMTDCRVFERFAEVGRGAEAVIRLTAAGSETLAEARCGFF